ncbi:hypothetical protein WA026_021986 [Henosepilachna vigintioctopunctata]|uniref:Integrase zinc-binding domain-containing protein n=1 Tax=Henosepilachna vigintioctopunctata TaxID=420089 RepID=A0AAW1VGQ8_9CUCU
MSKTTALLRYYWPHMVKDISKYVEECLQCQKYKVVQTKTPRTMQPNPVRQPWESLVTEVVRKRQMPEMEAFTETEMQAFLVKFFVRIEENRRQIRLEDEKRREQEKLWREPEKMEKGK